MNILLKVEATVTGNTFAVLTNVTVVKCEMAMADKTAVTNKTVVSNEMAVTDETFVTGETAVTDKTIAII